MPTYTKEELAANSTTKEELQQPSSNLGGFGFGRFGSARFGHVPGMGYQKEVLEDNTPTKEALPV